ncbi:hypothetical protein Tco_0673619, partial [Tanacetum coccineum]
METHCVNMELKYQNQALKDGQHGQILNETSNKAKINKEIEVLEKINIELEHSVAKLLADNEKTVENADLKAQIQEKVFANVALKNELRKLKGNTWILSTLNLSADQHPCFMIMASVDNTSGPVPQRKERCTLQCALSSKEEKSSCILSFEEIIEFLRHCRVAKSRITCVNTNGNTTLSEAHGVSLRITSGVRVRTVYHDLYLGGKALAEKENVGFDLARPLPQFCRRPLAKGVGLRVSDSHTGNHPKDDFMPLETIRRSYSVIKDRIPFELEGETFEPERRSFMIQGVDGEFNFLPEGGFKDNQGSFSTKSVNNETPILDAEPTSAVLPANVVDNIIDSSNTSYDDELPPVHPPTSSIPEASKVTGDASTPLDVDSDPDIHEFPSAKELKDATDYHWVVAHVTPPSWKQHLRDISIEQLCDIHDRAYMRHAVLDNMLNSRTRELISALLKARASCDAIREREVKRDKAYAEIEKKCNEALQDLDKNPLVFDMRSEIKTLQVINIPRATVGDTSLTRSYIHKVSQTPGIAPSIAHFYKPIKDRCIHKGRVVDQLYYTFDHIDRCFSNIRLNCLYEINEPIVPHFVLDFYSQVTLQRDASRVILISFMIQNEFITLSFQQFSQILRIPFDGQAVFTNKWDLAEQQYNLAYFFVKRIESARATPKAHLPYNMFLTRLFRHVMELYPYLDNGIYDVVERVMRLLALRQTRRPRSDRGKARHSVSLTSAHHNRGSLSHQGDDDEDDGASHASTPSPTTYLNFLGPLDYQQYDVPTYSKKNDDLLFEC